MSDVYFFIDGSALTAQIRSLRRSDPTFENRKLCPKKFVEYLMSGIPDLLEGTYKRFTFYFPTGDEAAADFYLELPDARQPGQVRDMHFKFCGQKLKKSADFDKWAEEECPARFRDRVTKSEKGIDIEMCCDALRLASRSHVDRIFLLTNDADFIPFCRTIKEFGTNISIIHLSDATTPNFDLVREADTYDVVPRDKLQGIFLPATLGAQDEGDEVAAAECGTTSTEGEDGSVPSDISSEKPVASPSDLPLADETGDESTGGADI